ncbi:unnamed protein product [Linum trigynum]|uniref:NAD-dependent epimerase/dehydratase domain-containing protein n=1 Tax=Linum trigynum TaxID=586398 RepID=A0AAV2G0D5_9ROSI
MRVVVTGASGYVGDRLCHALVERGHSVRALVRHTSDVSSLPPHSDNFELAYGDITNYRSLLDAFHGCDAVFHAAALTEPWLPDPTQFFAVNVEGLRNVVRAATATGTVKKLVCTLSASALGPTDGYVADEEQVHPEKTYCSEYERSQVAALKVAQQAASDGVPIVVVYLGIVYGPGKLTASNVVAHLLVELFGGGLLARAGFEKDIFSFSHIDDVVKGHIAAMDKGKAGETYMLTGENASFASLLDMAAAIAGTRKPSLKIPLWVFEILGWLLILVSRITGRPPLVSPSVVHVLRCQWAYSCEKAKRDLGYSPRGLKDGLLDVLPWLRSRELINY